MPLSKEQQKALAEDIVNNLEKYNVDAQEKTERTVRKMLANIRAKEEARKRVTQPSEYDIAKAMGYGDSKRRTGD